MVYGFVFEGKKEVNKPRYYGKYRAQVLKTDDPLQQGRIKVICPKVLGDHESAWALPCLPPNYTTLPKEGDLVWVEFEEGDVNRPIWCGVWYKAHDFP